MDKITSKMFNISFISVFFMYFKIIPISIETQPIIIIGCIFLCIFFFVRQTKFTIEKENCFLIIHIFLLVVYFIASIISNGNIYDSFIMFIKLLMGPLAYLTVLKNVKYLKEKYVKIIIVVFAFLLFIQTTRFPLLYNIVNNMYSMFFNRYTVYVVGSNSARGLSILVTEPSYFVYFEILLLYSIDFLKFKNKHFPNELAYKLIVFFIAILTKSAIVYLFTIVYIIQNIRIIKLIKKIKKYFENNIVFLVAAISLIIICILIFGNINMIRNTRFFQVISSITNLNVNNIGEILFFSDASSGFRFLTNIIGYLSIIIYPLGGGMLGVRNNFISIANIFGIDAYRNDVIRYSRSSMVEISAYMPTIVSVLGCSSIVIITYIFILRMKAKNKLSKQMFFSLFLFLFLIQSNLFNPVLWIIIGFINYINKESLYNERSNMHYNNKL